MSTLKRFYRNIIQNQVSFVAGENEEQIHMLELESHLATATYGGFTLTDAVRPSFDLDNVPRQGYKYDRIKLKAKNSDAFPFNHSRWLMPVLVASVSLEQLFETFLDILGALGDTVDIILETSHFHSGAWRTCLHRDMMDLPVLKSYLYDHEDILLNDGCTSISVHSSKSRAVVKFDEHKLLLIRAKSLTPFENILHRHNIHQDDTMPLLTDNKHIHITRDAYIQHFRTLQMALGIDESYTTTQ